MFKLLKWDLINFLQKYYLLYIGYAIFLALAAVFPANMGAASTAASILCGFFIAGFYFLTGFLAVTVTIGWTRRTSYPLAASLSASPRKILLSKLIMSGIILTSSFYLTLIYKLVYDRLQDVLSGSAFIPNAGNFGYVPAVFIYSIIFMFSYLAAQSNRLTRILPEISAIVISGLMYDAVYFITTGLFLGNRIPWISGTSVSLIGDNLSGQSMIYCILITSVILVGLFFAGCSLYEKHFERST